MTFAFFLLFALFLCFTDSQPLNCSNPISNCDDTINQFPTDTRINIKYANKTITNVNYSNNFVDVDIQSDNVAFKYRFVRCGCNVDYDSKRQTIFINPQSFYIEDGPIIALYKFLANDRINLIKAVQKGDFIFDSDVRQHVSDGGAIEVLDGNSIDYSKIKDANPVLSIIGTFFVNNYIDAQLGIPYLVAAEAQEQNPLARAEWMKIIGLVLNQTDEANNEFDQIEKRYNEAKVMAEKAVRRPAVFFNRPVVPFAPNPSAVTVDEKYDWTQPVTDEYIVQFVRDANADYRYIDEKPIAGQTGNSFNISTVVRDFKSADYLLQSSYFPGRDDRTLEEYLNDMVSATDPDPDARKQVETLKAVRCADVWNHQKRVTAEGADDFFESATFRPDLVLLDFIQALHPYLDFEKRETDYIYRYGETQNVPKRCPFTVLNGRASMDKEFVDSKFEVPVLDRYQIADRLEDKILPAIKERVNGRFEVFFHHEDVSEDITVVTVRVEVLSSEIDSFKSSSAVLLGMREALGDEVRQRNAETESGGISGGAIAAIVISVFVLVLAGVLFYRRKTRFNKLVQAATSAEWADPEAAGERSQVESDPFAV